MTVSAKTREAVRQIYGFCCAYCSVSEFHVGGQLEIDHFQPVSRGGTSELNNLVYACTTCNRFKAGYWPKRPTDFLLLHPQRDEAEAHMQLLENGRLQALTPRGQFHIDWLRLNRPQLVSVRRYQSSVVQLKAQIAHLNTVETSLRQQIQRLEQEVSLLQEMIARLTQ